MKKYLILFAVGCLTFLPAQAESVQAGRASLSDYVKSRVQINLLADFWARAQSNHAFVDAFADSLENFSNADAVAGEVSKTGGV